MEKNETIKYEFADMVSDVNSIKLQVNEHTSNERFKFDAIIGIARGGAIPAITLSHLLDIPCYIINWSVSGSIPEQKISQEIKNIITDSNNNILFIDDIIDKGDMLFDLMRFLFGIEKPTRAKIACLIYNTSQSLIIADYFGRIIDRQDTPQWFDFWWEQLGEV